MKLTLGLDIGSHTIKLIELARDGSSIGLVAAGSIPTPAKGFTSPSAEDTQALVAAIKKLIKDTGAKSKNVNVALPEAKIFTRVIEVPQLSDRELASAIRWEAEQYVPLPLTEVNLDFTILRAAKETGINKMEVLLVAAPKTLLEKYLSVLEMAEITPVAVETEVIASSRALVRSFPSVKTVMVVSMGAQTTDIAIVRSGIFTFTRSVAAGGDALTRAIAQSLDFTAAQAEEYKKTYGLQADKLEGKIVVATKPIMDTVTAEVKRAIAYYQEKYRDEHVQVVALCGGTARLPGMVTYLAQALGTEVQLANPWVGIAREPRFNVLSTEGPNFCVAVGLALRS